MNRQPQMRWMEHQIILARDDRFGLKFCHCLFTSFFRLFQPGIRFQILVTDRPRSGEAAARLDFIAASFSASRNSTFLPAGTSKGSLSNALIQVAVTAGVATILIRLR